MSKNFFIPGQKFNFQRRSLENFFKIFIPLAIGFLNRRLWVLFKDFKTIWVKMYINDFPLIVSLITVGCHVGLTTPRWPKNTKYKKWKFVNNLLKWFKFGKNSIQNYSDKIDSRKIDQVERSTLKKGKLPFVEFILLGKVGAMNAKKSKYSNFQEQNFWKVFPRK